MTWRRAFGWGAIAFTAVACSSEVNGPLTPASPPPSAPAPAPPAPPDGSIVDEVTGDYTLTLDLGSGCSILPESERKRTYQAAITSTQEALYTVTLTGGTFLHGLICTAHASSLDCNQFLGAREDGMIRFDLANNNDDAHGGHIVERLSSGGWVEIIGQATGHMEGTTIDARGKNSVWYCPTSMGYPFPCSSFAGCHSDDMRLTFTRR